MTEINAIFFHLKTLKKMNGASLPETDQVHILNSCI